MAKPAKQTFFLTQHLLQVDEVYLYYYKAKSICIFIHFFLHHHNVKISNLFYYQKCLSIYVKHWLQLPIVSLVVLLHSQIMFLTYACIVS